jgi:hypothetical protein
VPLPDVVLAVYRVPSAGLEIVPSEEAFMKTARRLPFPLVQLTVMAVVPIEVKLIALADVVGAKARTVVVPLLYEIV